MEELAAAYERSCASLKVAPSKLITSAFQEHAASGVGLTFLKLNGNDPNLFNNRWGDMDVKALCEAICSLKEPSGILHIDLSYHNIGNEGAAALSTLLSSPTISLKSFRLQGNNIGVEGVAALIAPLKKITTLEHINLNGNPLGNKGGMLIAEMLNVNRTLTVVDIGNTDLGIESVVALSTVLRDNMSVKEFNIENALVQNELQQTAIFHIAHMLSLNHGIEKIHLGKIGMRDEGARQLALQLFGNRTLKYLDLRANQIGPAGAEALAELLVKDSSLLKINLEANRIKNDGARAVAAALRHNTRLLSINMSQNSISDDGLCALAEGLGANPILQEVLLWGNSFGPYSSPMFGSLFEGRFKYYSMKTDFVSYVVDGATHIAKK